MTILRLHNQIINNESSITDEKKLQMNGTAQIRSKQITEKEYDVTSYL